MWASAKRESFNREMLYFIEFAKVFTCKSFRLYGTYPEGQSGRYLDCSVVRTVEPEICHTALPRGGRVGEEGRRRRWWRERDGEKEWTLSALKNHLAVYMCIF